MPRRDRVQGEGGGQKRKRVNRERLRSPALSSRTVVCAYVSSEQSSFITIAMGKRKREKEDTPNYHRETLVSSARPPATRSFVFR